mmetsp:Transcript_34695/g.93958  ORF Transcript_34695/g.93958 Transcript_34695/m.93958 type:complete len:200 (+) Transcript_34695:305-904(+)
MPSSRVPLRFSSCRSTRWACCSASSLASRRRRSPCTMSCPSAIETARWRISLLTQLTCPSSSFSKREVHSHLPWSSIPVLIWLSSLCTQAACESSCSSRRLAHSRAEAARRSCSAFSDEASWRSSVFTQSLWDFRSCSSRVSHSRVSLRWSSVAWIMAPRRRSSPWTQSTCMSNCCSMRNVLSLNDAPWSWSTCVLACS